MQIPRLPGMKTARTVVGLSIESSQLAAVMLHRRNGHSDVIATCALPATPSQLLANPEQVGRDLAARLQQAGIREKRCALCLPPAWALTAAVEVPPVEPEDIHGYFALRAEREFPMSPSELQFAHSAYQLSSGEKMATLAAIPTERLEAVSRMLAAAGCRAVSISLGIDARLPKSDSSGSLNFIANGSHVDVVICAGGGVIDLRSLDGSPAPEGTATTLDAAALHRELRITLGRIPSHLLSQIQDGRFLGRAASARALRTLLEQPLQDWGIHNLEGGEAESDHEAAAFNVGSVVAEEHLYGRPATFEFVLPKVTRLRTLIKRLSTRRNRIVSMAVPLLLGVLILVLVVRSQYENRLASRWATMEDTVTELDSLQQGIRQFRPWFSDTPESLEVLEELTSTFPETGEVWARRIELEQNQQVTCTGMARDHAALMAVIDRLHARPEADDIQVQQVRGEAPIHFSFSYTWRRNRRD